VPKIEERELNTTRAELEGQFVTVIYDGTSRLGEAVNVCTRHVPPTLSKIIQRLVAFKTTAKHMDGSGLFRFLSLVLMTDMRIQPLLVVGDSRDSCATNGVAHRNLKTLCTAMHANLCTSHTLQHTGEHLGLDTVEELLTPYLLLISSCPAAVALWLEIMGVAAKLYSKIRWWSRWEIMKQLGKYFHLLGQFIDELVKREIGDATTRALKHVYTTKTAALQLELAAAMDMEILCTTTYKLEGDGLEILLVYDMLETIRTKGRTLGNDASDLPNLAAVMRTKKKLEIHVPIIDTFDDGNTYTGKISKMPANNRGKYQVTFSDGSTLNYDTEREVREAINVRSLTQWQPLVNKLKGGFTYLENRLTDNCDAPYHMKAQHEATELFKIFDPSFAAGNLTPAFVDRLRTIAPLEEHIDFDKLKREVPAFLTACALASPSTTATSRSSPRRCSSSGPITARSSRSGRAQHASSSRSPPTPRRASASSRSSSGCLATCRCPRWPTTSKRRSCCATTAARWARS
jgi:hypothetical protein